jgi:hypothetical protein
MKRKCDYSGLEADCHHCDKPFPQTQLKWHAARCTTHKQTSILRCRSCGCMTPIIFRAGA